MRRYPFSRFAYWISTERDTRSSWIRQYLEPRMLAARERLTCRLHLRSKLAAMEANIAATPEPFLSRRYLPVVEELTKSHKLKVPAATIEMLAATIMKCRILKPRPKKKKGKELSPRECIERARNHARKLLEYTERRPSRADSISKRSASLRKSLDDFNVVIWLAAESPPIDVPSLLGRLESDVLSKDELENLIGGLNSTMSRKAERPGRPKGILARVIYAGCYVWASANCERAYHSDGEKLLGPLPPFIRDLLSCCDGTHQHVRYIERLRHPKRAAGLKITDAALYSALKDALPFCKALIKRRK